MKSRPLDTWEVVRSQRRRKEETNKNWEYQIPRVRASAKQMSSASDSRRDRFLVICFSATLSTMLPPYHRSFTGDFTSDSENRNRSNARENSSYAVGVRRAAGASVQHSRRASSTRDSRTSSIN